MGRAAERLEGCDMAAQHGCQVLVDDEARPDQPRVAEHHGEQPDDARRAGLVGEHDLEAGEIDLALLAGRRSRSAPRKAGSARRPDVAQEVGDRGVAPRVAALLQLAQQTDPGQPG